MELLKRKFENQVGKPARNAVDLIHRNIVHPLLTGGEASEDREIAHERALSLAKAVQGSETAMALMEEAFSYRDPILELKMGSMSLPGPLGMAGGFDKNAIIHKFLGRGMGFGFVTVGSVTKIPYKGNDRPRIFDLPNNDGLVNRMGFPGEGSNGVQQRLEKERKHFREYGLIINVAASKPSFENGTVIEDYGDVYEQFLPYGDAHEVNISSPNTPGVRGLQEPEVFTDLAIHLGQIHKNSRYKDKSLIYKFSLDLDPKTLKQDIRIALDNGASGFTIGNTSTNPELRASLMPDEHKDEMGGMSGAFLNRRALALTHGIYEEFGESIFIIRAGGIRGTGEDLWNALAYGGATAAEAYSSFVRPTTSTPNFTYNAHRDLARAMKLLGMRGMEDFKALRGIKSPYPLAR